MLQLYNVSPHHNETARFSVTWFDFLGNVIICFLAGN